MKLSLIPDWRRAWRFTSVQAAAALVLLSLIQAEVLPSAQAFVPVKYWPMVTAGFGLAIGILRVISQAGLRKPEEPSQ